MKCAVPTVECHESNRFSLSLESMDIHFQKQDPRLGSLVTQGSSVDERLLFCRVLVVDPILNSPRSFVYYYDRTACNIIGNFSF